MCCLVCLVVNLIGPEDRELPGLGWVHTKNYQVDELLISASKDVNGTWESPNPNRDFPIPGINIPISQVAERILQKILLFCITYGYMQAGTDPRVMHSPPATVNVAGRLKFLNIQHVDVQNSRQNWLSDIQKIQLSGNFATHFHQGSASQPLRPNHHPLRIFGSDPACKPSSLRVCGIERVLSLPLPPLDQCWRYYVFGLSVH